MRANVRDPLVDRLVGPGKAFELVDEEIRGITLQVVKGAPRNLAGIFRQAMTYGSRCMVKHEGVDLTYDELFARAASLSTALRDRFGVRKGTMVAVVMANRSEWITSLVAVTAAGGVAALVNSRGAAEEMLRAMTQTGCELAILDAERADIIAAVEPDPHWPRILIGQGASSLRPGKDASFAELSAPVAGRTLEPLEMSPDDGGVVLFTSGTTGFPKGALLSHGALAHSVSLSTMMGAVQDLRYEEEAGETLPPDRRAMISPSFIMGPMFHLSGMLPTFRAMSVGATTHIMGKWNADIAFDMIENEGLTRLSFVPAMLWDMMRSPRAGASNLGRILYLVNGGAALDPALLAEAQAFMPKALVVNTYGQSENTAWACSISGRTYLENPSSCGWAVPTIDVQVRREDGSEADVGERGEVWVRSPGVMNGYVGDPKATAETLRDGWCASGDIGFVDEGGLFTIVDRKKNMVISGGENIYCAEVERVLGDHPKVLEAIAYGVPDTRLGERLVATVVLEPGAEAEEDEIKAYCKGRLAIYKVPRAVAFTRERLARTASGKVDRGLILRQAREEAQPRAREPAAGA